MNSKLQRYIKAKRDPALSVVEYLESIDRLAKDLVEKAVETRKSDIDLEVEKIKSGLKKQTPLLIEDLSKKMKEFLLKEASRFKGEPGTRGEKGESIQGPVGPQGPEGKPGKNPVPGIDYPSEEEVRLLVDRSIPKESFFEKLIHKILKTKLFEQPSIKNVVKSIEKLATKDKLDYYKGLKNQPDIPNQASIDNRVHSILRGGGDRVRVSELTGDGSSKTFTVPRHKRALLLISTDFPILYKSTVDFTTSGTTLTLTSEVAAPSNGASISFLYVE